VGDDVAKNAGDGDGPGPARLDPYGMPAFGAAAGDTNRRLAATSRPMPTRYTTAAPGSQNTPPAKAPSQRGSRLLDAASVPTYAHSTSPIR
jgi:hypothetical protein